MRMHKGMTNVELRELLDDVAASYQIKEGNKARFKIIAYNRAADAVEHLSSEAKDLWDDGKLEDVAGIGKSIAGHLGDIFSKGTSPHFEDLFQKLPPAIFELMRVPGVGAKTAYKLTQEFDIPEKNALQALKKLATEGKIEKLEGFGKDSQDSILKSIDEVSGRTTRLLLPFAMHLAQEIVDWLKESKEVKEAIALGSLRRKASTVGDIDIAASTTHPAEVIKHFCSYPHKTRILEQGDRTASIIVPGERQIDLMVEKPESFGSLVQHFTGSKHHNIALRKLALKKNLSVSDYGITDKKTSKRHLFPDEKSFYAFLGMEWIPPEIREDRGEIEKALKNEIPELLTLEDVRADLHMHSDFDIETSHDLGISSMKELVEKGNELGYEYLAFTEHNPSHSKHSKNEIKTLLNKKREAIEHINSSLKSGVKNKVQKVFNSLEVDILPDGDLAVDDEALEILDFALVSIHSSFKQSRDQMTQRVLKGLDHPKVKIFAHPTARKLNERESIDLDWDKIFEFCKANNKLLEINASSSRLDLPDVLVKDAIDRGIMLTLGTDSHAADQMDGMEFGVYNARKGWAQKKHIANTLSLKDFENVVR